MRTVRLVVSVLGLLLIAGGVTFVFQGLGIVGPPESFMYSNTQWIYNGTVVLAIGAIVTALGVWPRSTGGKET
jgi:hypothetical protein